MKIVSPVVLCLLLAITVLPVSANSGESARSGVGPVLKQMSDKLASSGAFRVEMRRTIAGTSGNGDPENRKARIEIICHRPSQVVARRIDRDSQIYICFDGERFSMLDTSNDTYATALMHGSLDTLLAQLNASYGCVPPLACMFSADASKALRANSSRILYGGKVSVSGNAVGIANVECDKVIFNSPAAESELWIGTRDHLPKRIVTKSKANGIKVETDFLNWKLNVKTSKNDFVFKPGNELTELQLEPNDRHLANPAQCYAMLQICSEANAELPSGAIAGKARIGVLTAKLLLAKKQENWTELRDVAQQLMNLQPGNAQWPISLAYAVRRTSSIQAARRVLMQIAARFPDNSTIPYNIACYDAQLGNLDSARHYLSRAFEMNPDTKSKASVDPDLQPLWIGPQQGRKLAGLEPGVE